MRDERMEVLKLLEKGVINAAEAERLLMALKGESKTSFGDTMGGTINKTTEVLQGLAEKMSEKAAIVLDEAKNCAEKLEPKLKKAAEKVSEKTAEMKEDAKTYAEKLKQKREQAEQAKEEDADIFSSEVQESQETEEMDSEEVPKEDNLDINEPEDLELAKKMKSLDSYMERLQNQMGVIDEAEEFLKTFEADYDEDEEEGDEKKEGQDKPEE